MALSRITEAVASFTDLTIGDDLTLTDDLLMASDANIIKFGADADVTLTHVHDSGLALKHTATADDKPIILTLQTGETDIAANDVIGAINFQAPDEGTGTDAVLVAAGIEAVSEGDFSASNNATKLSFKTGASEAAAEKMSLSSAGLLTIADDLVIKDGGTIGVSSDADSITIASDGVVTFSQAPVFPDGSIAVADLDIDGATDIGAAIVDADLFIVDDGAGGTNRKTTAARLKTYINAGVSSAADDISAGDAAVTITTSSGNITIDAAANDSDIILKGTDGGADTDFLTIDGSAAGEATFNAGIVIADAGNIGSASDKDAIAISSGGVVTMNQIPVLSAGLNVSGGTIAGTLSTAAQGNITSLGTLTALTVDDVAIDGKVMTMTGSSSDTFVVTVGTDGATSLVTTDAAAAAALTRTPGMVRC